MGEAEAILIVANILFLTLTVGRFGLPNNEEKGLNGHK